MTDVSLDGFDPFSAEIQQHPEPYYARMRREQPVFRVGDTPLFIVSRYDDVVAALRQPKVFSNQFAGPSAPFGGGGDPELAAIVAEGYRPVSTLLTADPPAHTRYRKLVDRAFTPRRVQLLVPFMHEVADELIDAFVEDGRCEIVTQLAVPLPVHLIAFALGVPAERKGDFKRWSDDSIAAIGAVISRERQLSAARGVVEFQRYFASELEDRRAHPRDDLLTDLVQARIEHPEAGEDASPLTMEEMLSILQQILVAGNETTTKLIAEACRLLVEHPEAADRVRTDPGLIPNLVEEALRLAAPTQGMFRVVTQDTVLAGTEIPRGSMCVLMYASANRDEDGFADPDSFVPERPNAKDHLSFGKGVHFCLGASLARAEACVALEKILTRLGDLRFGADNEFAYEPSFILRGLRRLSLEFTPGPPVRR